MHLGQVQDFPHGRARRTAKKEPEMLRAPSRRASGCGLERDEDQSPNHGKGEQRRLDGVNEIHGTNFAGKVTPPALSQRTCSQSVGDAGLRFVGFSRLASRHAPSRGYLWASGRLAMGDPASTACILELLVIYLQCIPKGLAPYQPTLPGARWSE